MFGGKKQKIFNFNVSLTFSEQFKNISFLKYNHQMSNEKIQTEGYVMSKKNFVTLILSVIGFVMFALGMCMALLPEWNAFNQGVITGTIGIVILLVMVMVRRKMSGKPVFVKLSGKTIGAIVLGTIGALTLGVGMCMVMVWEMMVLGIVVGLAGIILLICLIPLLKGIK